jgi:hypothetical protein
MRRNQQRRYFVAMSKYEQLYHLAKDLVEQTEARFDTIDAKAANYLSVLTLLIGAAAFFLKWVTDTLIPPAGVLQWTLSVVALGVGSCVVAAWLTVFRVLRSHRLRMPALNDEMIQFFDANEEVDIYYALVRRYEQAWAQNEMVNDTKPRDLARGYRLIILTVVLLTAFAALYTAYVWTS